MSPLLDQRPSLSNPRSTVAVRRHDSRFHSPWQELAPLLRSPKVCSPPWLRGQIYGALRGELSRPRYPWRAWSRVCRARQFPLDVAQGGGPSTPPSGYLIVTPVLRFLEQKNASWCNFSHPISGAGLSVFSLLWRSALPRFSPQAVALATQPRRGSWLRCPSCRETACGGQLDRSLG